MRSVRLQTARVIFLSTRPTVLPHITLRTHSTGTDHSVLREQHPLPTLDSRLVPPPGFPVRRYPHSLLVALWAQMPQGLDLNRRLGDPQQVPQSTLTSISDMRPAWASVPPGLARGAPSTGVSGRRPRRSGNTQRSSRSSIRRKALGATMGMAAQGCSVSRS